MYVIAYVNKVRLFYVKVVKRCVTGACVRIGEHPRCVVGRDGYAQGGGGGTRG